MVQPNMPLPARISILDRAHTRVGFLPSNALQHVLGRAVLAEELGYHRFWVAEHHAVPGIAGSVPAVLMAAIAGRTRSIRVGSGGIMLPNHQPLVVAEQATTLEALHPGRIDLGLGRSLGFTQAVRKALKNGKQDAERFEEDLTELLGYLSGSAPVTVRPETLRSLRFSCWPRDPASTLLLEPAWRWSLEGQGVFRTDQRGKIQALERYRARFRPSRWFDKPFVLVAVNTALGPSRDDARDLLLPEAIALARSRTTGEFAALAPVDSAQGSGLTPGSLLPWRAASRRRFTAPPPRFGAS
ncbi:MsnO8 family LLM class oxidoreductase [Arthrobacter sp. SA17]